jgi:hypothetical protein
MNHLLIAFLLLCTSTLSAQLDLDNFLLGANAKKLNEQCIRLTPDYPYARGSAWYKEAIDLTMPFDMQVCLVLGCNDEEGADGIVFVFHPTLNTGYWGEGMGFAGLVPSLGIEFDTYQNYHLGDPADDHLSVMRDGRINHHSSMIGPILLPNLEDCQKHPLRIQWQPTEQKLDIYLDGDLQATYEGDLINDIFQGRSTVYWGVTAATGRLSNHHDICIKKLLFAEARVPLRMR